MSSKTFLIDASYENAKAVLEGVPYYPDEIWKFAAMAKRFPAVSAAQIVHAHWEWHGGDDDCMTYGFCSNCHNGYEEDLAMVYKYCPSCGAKMDGERKVGG